MKRKALISGCLLALGACAADHNVMFRISAKEMNSAWTHKVYQENASFVQEGVAPFNRSDLSRLSDGICRWADLSREQARCRYRMTLGTHGFGERKDSTLSRTKDGWRF